MVQKVDSYQKAVWLIAEHSLKEADDIVRNVLNKDDKNFYANKFQKMQTKFDDRKLFIYSVLSKGLFDSVGLSLKEVDLYKLWYKK